MGAGERRHRRQPERQRDGAAHADGQGPDLQSKSRRLQTHGGGEREGIERRHLSDPHRVKAAAPRLDGDVDDLGIRAIQPERRHHLEILGPQAGPVGQSWEMFVGRSSSRRPEIS